MVMTHIHMQKISHRSVGSKARAETRTIRRTWPVALLSPLSANVVGKHYYLSYSIRRIQYCNSITDRFKVSGDDHIYEKHRLEWGGGILASLALVLRCAGVWHANYDISQCWHHSQTAPILTAWASDRPDLKLYGVWFLMRLTQFVGIVICLFIFTQQSIRVLADRAGSVLLTVWLIVGLRVVCLWVQRWCFVAKHLSRSRLFYMWALSQRKATHTYRAYIRFQWVSEFANKTTDITTEDVGLSAVATRRSKAMISAVAEPVPDSVA